MPRPHPPEFSSVSCQIETSRDQPFDVTIFEDKTFAGGTLSNFLLDGSAGTLVVHSVWCSAAPAGPRSNRGYSPSAIW